MVRACAGIPTYTPFQLRRFSFAKRSVAKTGSGQKETKENCKQGGGVVVCREAQASAVMERPKEQHAVGRAAGKKRPTSPRFTLQRSLYRDRLGTNIGKLIKDRFLAGGALMAAVDGGADDATRRR